MSIYLSYSFTFYSLHLYSNVCIFYSFLWKNMLITFVHFCVTFALFFTFSIQGKINKHVENNIGCVKMYVSTNVLFH